MKFYRFDQESRKQITKFDSDFVMSRIIQTSENAHIGCMHIPANGVVGYHQAASPQLMLIMSGKGRVRSGNNDYADVKAGEAVLGKWRMARNHI